MLLSGGWALTAHNCANRDANFNTVLDRTRSSPVQKGFEISHVTKIKQTRTSRGSQRVCSSLAPLVTAAPEAKKTFFWDDSDVLASFKQLQNGSDVRGVAIEGVPNQALTLSPVQAFFIGQAFAEWLAEKTKTPVDSLRISIGRDPRLSGQMLKGALAAGMATAGASVEVMGLGTTPAIFMSCILPGMKGEPPFQGGVMITASHLPYNRNGFKFFTAEGGLDKGDITALMKSAALIASTSGVPVLDRFAGPASVMAAAIGVDPTKVNRVEFMPVYSEHLREIIKREVAHPEHPDQPLKGMKIVVDAGNGSGGFFAINVLAPLGADIEGSQFLDPDGWFPNHVPNPEDKAAMDAGVEAVLRSGADLGVVFDTDVDRSAVVAADGSPINSNRYIALMAAITLRKYPGATIVTDSVTSNGLTDYISSLGGKHFRYKRGYKNVIGKGVELNNEGIDTQLMMETSGHGAMKENYFLDDGAYSAVQIIIEVVKRRLDGRGDVVADLLANLKEPLESQEFRIKLPVGSFKEDQTRILDAFRSWVTSEEAEKKGWKLEDVNHEGWRVAVDEGEGRKGWFLLRASLHDPLLVLNVESDAPGGLRAIVDEVHGFFESTASDVADFSALQKDH